MYDEENTTDLLFFFLFRRTRKKCNTSIMLKKKKKIVYFVYDCVKRYLRVYNGIKALNIEKKHDNNGTPACTNVYYVIVCFIDGTNNR